MKRANLILMAALAAAGLVGATGALLTPAMVGFYAVALTLEGQLYATFHDIGEVLFPAVSHREGTGHLGDARRLSLLGGWALSTAFGAFAAVLATVGGDFLHLWISAETARQGTTALRLLCVAGIGGMGYRRFAFFNVIGAAGWILSMTLMGYVAGTRFPILVKHIEKVIIVVVFVSILPGIIAYAKARLGKRMPAPGAEP